METCFLDYKMYKELRGDRRWRADIDEFFDPDRLPAAGPLCRP